MDCPPLSLPNQEGWPNQEEVRVRAGMSARERVFTSVFASALVLVLVLVCSCLQVRALVCVC